jgi:glycosyltransferase involved in cell wall biosynthesis
VSVYKKERPEYFTRAIESIVNQTLQPSEIVIVKDGELTDELDRVLDRCTFKYPGLFKIVPIPQHVGLGEALRRGVLNCSHGIIARMDSDDISHPERFGRQMSFLTAHPEIDLVGSWINEFEDHEDYIYASRELPTASHEIRKFARKRNPVNHMTVVFRKEAVLDAGNYQPFLWFEDYYLWVRMLLNGSRFANLPYHLVNVRAAGNLITRRKGVKYAMSEIKVQKEFLDIGFINCFEFIRNVTIRVILRMLPPRVILTIYGAVFRKQQKKSPVSYRMIREEKA